MCIANTPGWDSDACTLPIQQAAFTSSVNVHKNADMSLAWKRD